MKNVEEFFRNYAIASTEGKVKTLAKFYADAFVAASKTETMAFSNDAKFLDWLEQVYEFNQKSGMKEMIVQKVDASKVGEFFLNATVTWGATFEKLPGEVISFDIHYLLNAAGDELKIIGYISEEDQEKLMKEKGLL